MARDIMVSLLTCVITQHFEATRSPGGQVLPGAGVREQVCQAEGSQPLPEATQQALAGGGGATWSSRCMGSGGQLRVSLQDPLKTGRGDVGASTLLQAQGLA